MATACRPGGDARSDGSPPTRSPCRPSPAASTSFRAPRRRASIQPQSFATATAPTARRESPPAPPATARCATIAAIVFAALPVLAAPSLFQLFPAVLADRQNQFGRRPIGETKLPSGTQPAAARPSATGVIVEALPGLTGDLAYRSRPASVASGVSHARVENFDVTPSAIFTRVCARPHVVAAAAFGRLRPLLRRSAFPSCNAGDRRSLRRR